MMNNDERSKVKELLKEKEKCGSRLEWMYHENKPDNEDFLLGKKIEKVCDQEQKQNDSYGALFQERIQHNIEMDTKAKMREDPLFAIRKMEDDAKKRLLDNPVKMKQLQKTIQKQTSKNKKSKHQKQRKHSDSGSNDDDLVSKYLNILNAKHKGSKNIMANEEGKRHNAKKMLNNKEKTYERRNVSSDKLHDESRSKYKTRDESRERSYPKGRKKDGFKKRYSRSSSSSYDNSSNEEDKRDIRYEKYDVRDHKDFDSRKGHLNINDSGSKLKQFKGGTDKKYDKQGWKVSIQEIDSDNESKKHKSHRHKICGGKEIKNSSCKKRRHSSSSSGNQQSENRKYKSGTNRSKQTKKEKGSRDHSLSSAAEDTDHIYKKHNQDSSSDGSLSHSGNSDMKAASKRQLSDSDNEKYGKAKSFGLVILNPEALEAQKRHECSSRSRSWNRKPIKEKKPLQAARSSRSWKLTDEEKQKQVEEMMKNAQWWEDQRKTKVKQYAFEEQMEESNHKINLETTGSSEFIIPMMSLHAENSSVEDRIKRNKHNILRTKADMERGFSKR